jgi:hypothetical protein
MAPGGREHVAAIRGLIWPFYRDLKAYRPNPSRQRRAALRARFERIFTRKTGFVTLDRLLARIHANKRELLTGAFADMSASAWSWRQGLPAKL